MASQLAAFTSVEQLQNLNSTMEGLKKAQAPMQQFEALNFIGKSVAGDSSEITRVKGDTNHDFQYKLLKEAQDIKLKIKNSQGEVVREFSFKNL
jgi:flagellar basal-body rod modification protein FlgD